uniref:TEP1-F n=1 Tax=Anopheles gambiae TaxID=7165 RepID=A0A1S4H5V7_ANOGA
MRHLASASLLVITLLINFVHGILIVGPKHIRAGQNYTVILSSFESNTNERNLLLQLDGLSAGGKKLLHLGQPTRVQPLSNSVISFPLPESLPAGSYKLTIDGQNGFKFHREADLLLAASTTTALVQLSKPIYKPGDVLQFRVIVLGGDLKPPAPSVTATVIVHDPQRNVIRRWTAVSLQLGVFEEQLQIGTVPLLGRYTITVTVTGANEIVSKTFDVREYVLPAFEVAVKARAVPLEKHQRLNLTLSARYYTGQPVRGVATVELYLEDDKLDQRRVVGVYGAIQLDLPFNEHLSVYDDSQDVRVHVAFTQDETNRTIYKEQRITVYKLPYRVELVKEQPEFRAKVPFDCQLRVRYQDGTPAKGAAFEVKVEGAYTTDRRVAYTSDAAGVIKLTLQPEASSESIDITVNAGSEELLYERISKREASKAFLQVKLDSDVKIGKPFKLKVTCNEELSFFMYYVVSRGVIVDSAFLQPKKVTEHFIEIEASDQMVPRSKVIVVTVAKNVVLCDFVDIDFEDLRNNFDLQIDRTEIRPGDQLQLNMRGPPGAFVALAAYDKSLLQYSNNHDIFWEDVWGVFDKFYSVERNEFDLFHSLGLFARTMEHITFDKANDQTARDGSSSSKNGPSNSQASFRTNFLESWLWKTDKIGSSGSATTKESVPDTITAWHLTGFSIDPVYGLGIIKQPLQLTTVQPFYIVPNMPYSIKRGELVELQFIVFNNFPKKYKASVTLFSVDNQTEFVGRPATETSYTKSIEASPDTGVPVAFLIKARKLGEMTVRVDASIEPAKDSIESVIRVIPESLVKREMISRFFCHNTYQNQSFVLGLDFDRKADAGTRKIDFILTPNILTSVMDNLESLLSVPTGCGEQNMMRLVPIVLVLDYLTSIGSADKQLTAKAIGLLRAGYQNQMRYRQPDGSFGLWEKSGGAVFLTAFVGKTLATAAKYISEIEPSMVEQAFDWLAARQHSTGRFDEVGPVFHRDMQGGLRQGIALTSFVLIALLEQPKVATKHRAAIEKGIDYVTQTLGSIEDSYDLAIATYALLLQKHSSGERFLEKLIGLSTVQQNGTERFWARDAHGIETTAYGLLSFVLAEKYVDGTSIMRWLVKQRYTPGSFPRTQDTFVGLKALTKLAEKISPSRNDYSVQLRHAGRKKEFRVTSQDIGTLQNAQQGVDETAQLELHVAGIGFGLLQVVYEYGVDLRNFTAQFVLELQKSVTNANHQLQLEVCSSFTPQLSDGRSNMVLVEVNFPSGYTVEQRGQPITGATKHNPIQKTEVRFGATSVVVYYNSMGPERNCFTITAYRRQKVTLKRPAYVLVHDYYDPKLNAIKMYQVDD